MNLCIIPARKGSKRIPGKNIREFMGKPIYHYSVDVACECRLFDEIIIATNDEYFYRWRGIKIYRRQGKNATDDATLYQAIIETLFAVGATNGRIHKYENVCIIYPCAPFITPERLKEGYELLQKGFDTVFPVQEIGYHIERTLRFIRHSKSNKVEEIFQVYKDMNAAPNWREYYKHVGQWFWCRIDKLLKNGTIIPENSGAIVLPWWEAQECDNEIDWEIMEWKYDVFLKKQK